MTRRRRILLVEDYPDSAEAMRSLVEVLGHDCMTSPTGRGALVIAEAFAPDIVLLDLGLPDLDGFQVARRLRAWFGASQPRIVAITGWTGDDVHKRALAAGIDRVFLKPITAELLRQIIAGDGTDDRS